MGPCALLDRRQGAGRMQRQGRHPVRPMCLLLLLDGMAVSAKLTGYGSANGYF